MKKKLRNTGIEHGTHTSLEDSTARLGDPVPCSPTIFGNVSVSLVGGNICI